MTQPESFDNMLAGLRAGDPEAGRLLFQRFAARLIALARTHLDGCLRQKLDPDDVVQSAFKSFFPRLAGGQFELEDWESLWSLLVTITLRKCGKKVRHFYRPARDVRREIAADTDGPASVAVSGEPTPQEAAMLAETVEWTMRGLDSGQRQIVELRLQGFTVAEIGAQVGRTEHTVEGVLRRLRRRLLRERDQDETN